MNNSLRSIDLNLLVTLDALLSTQNVTRAAEQLCLSQPTVSVQLAKLRMIFKDPLLLPGPRGMQPTARAEALRIPLKHALEVLRQAVEPASPFDPATADQTWRIAATDYSESTILQRTLPALRIQAPHTRLAIFELSPALLARRLEQGEIDLAFHASDDTSDKLRYRLMFSERYILASRKNHPHLQDTLTLSTFCELEHVIVSPTGGGFHGPMDTELARMGLSRRVVLSVPHFLFLKSALLSTDLVAILPARLIENDSTLQVTEPPISIPGFDMLMLWHERLHLDPAHQWLRKQIAQSII